MATSNKTLVPLSRSSLFRQIRSKIRENSQTLLRVAREE